MTSYSIDGFQQKSNQHNLKIEISFPLLAEQLTIVEKVDQQREKIDVLETAIKTRREQAEQMMLAVLRWHLSKQKTTKKIAN